MDRLPVIPDELLAALARDQPTRTTRTEEEEEEGELLPMQENNNNKNIWNRIGFSSTAQQQQQQQQQLTIKPTTNIIKKTSTKQTQPRQRRTKNNEQTSNHPYQQQQQQPTTPTSTQPASARARASFSFDHYIQTHLSPSHQKSTPTNTDPNKPRSRFIGSEIINGIFSNNNNTNNSNNKSSPHLPPQQPLEKLEQPTTRTSSINASKHFNISRASVDQIFPNGPSSSSSISTSTTSTSTPSRRTNQPHSSRPAKPLRQPSLDESSLSSSSRPNLPPTTISSDRWSSTAVSVTLEDEIAEDDLLMIDNDPPWSNRETFTHELRANRPEEENLLIPHQENSPPTPQHPHPTGTTTLTTTTTTTTPPSTLLPAGTPQQNLIGNISRIPLPSNRSIIHQPIPSTHFVVGDDGPTSLSARHVSIPASSSSHPDRSRSRSQSVINFSSHHLVRQHTGSGGLRQQIEARRALLASSSPSFQNPPNPGPDLLLPPPPPSSSSSSHPLPAQPAPQTIAAAHTAPISLLSTADNKLSSSSSSSSSSSHGRSLSDTFIRKTRSLIAHPHHQHHLDHTFQHYHAPLHSSSPSPLQSVNSGKEIPAHLAKEMVFKDLGLQSTAHVGTSAHQHLDPRILDHAQLLQLFQSTTHPSSSSSANGIPLPSPKTSDHPSASLEEELEEEEEAELQLIDTPETREALNVKADFVIAVAGPKGVGKSTIISKALRKPVDQQHAVVLYHDPSDNRITSIISSIVNQATGNKKVLQILEIDQSILNENCIIGNNKNSQNKTIKKSKKSSSGKEEGLVWPANLPHLDGVLLCYDATDPLALDHLRPLLHSFWTRGGISLIVLACKSDKEELKNATNPLKAAELVNVYGTGMIQLDGGLEDPGKKMRNSFNWIVKAIKEARGERRSYSSASSTNILGSIYGDEERRGSTSSSIAASPSPMTTMGMTIGSGVGGAVTEGQQISVMSGGSGASEEEELNQPADPASVILSPSGKTAVPSPGRTPRKALPHSPLATAVATGTAKIGSTVAPARLFISSSSPVLPLDPSLHLDDADGDSFSNNALVAMSYEKSTRPDGSFMHGGSTPGSPREERKPNGELPDPPSEPTLISPANNVGVTDRAHTSSLLNPAPLSSEPSIHSKNAPSEDLSRAVDPVKGLSGSGKHAVQKAIAMSQRGIDMDLHFEKQVIIDKFVFATVSGNEPSFVDQFLIIFRRFATPFEVLSALISRFEFVSTHIERDPILGRYAHLKICHVLMSWLEIYPGDFVQPATLTVLKAFNSLMVSVTWLLHYAIEIMPMIKTIGSMTDEDVGWALPDSTEETAVKEVLDSIKKLHTSLAPMDSSSSAESRGSVAAESNDEPTLPMTPLTAGKSADYSHSELSPRLENFPSASFMSTDHVASTAASSPVHSFSPHDRHHLLLKSNEDPQKPGDLLLQQQQQQQHLHHPLSALDSTENFIAATLPLKSTLTSSSLHSDHKAELKSLLDSSVLLLSLPEESIALQITRLEWNIFSKMKPRHLIRYVLAPRDPNNPRKALRDPNSPIAKSTDYLNYLAVWASSMILIHEKLKSRARVLLKLMKVAYELRDMDDFHSLMGVLAGIEAQPVYRLDATFEIVQHMDLQSYRRYLSLKKLMSSQRSFSAYRLARQTASSQCVPYLGTYLQDITAVNEVKDDMKDGKVNLTKMIQIAKSASSVINCNLLAPKIVFDPKISNLIIKIPVLSEDAQYELSYKYKPRLQSSSHHSSHQVGSSSIHAGGSSGGGIMSVLAAAAATAGTSGTTSNASHSDPTNPKGPSGPLTTSVSSGSLIPGSSSSNNLFSTSTSPSASSANNLASSTALNPTTNTTSSSISTHTSTGHGNSHNNGSSSSSSAIHSVANVGAATSLVAKKGTRKLKQLLSTAISTHNHSQSAPGHHGLPQQQQQQQQQQPIHHQSNGIGHSNH